MRALRGAAIGMVFQEPMVSLNPALTVGMQLAEGLRLHRGLPRDEIRERSLEMLRRVQIADPERCLAAHPHEFSGRMRQRIMLVRTEKQQSELPSTKANLYALFCMKKTKKMLQITTYSVAYIHIS